ncbi:MAG: hypothetical protein K6E50_05625 [Lachnospiraceae bacterium]|nr:hypothetical protein [Lachnospiraceae bacterium]
MDRIRFADKRIFGLVALLWIVGIVFNLIPVTGRRLHNVSATMFCLIIMLWSLSLQHRILDRRICLRMRICCLSMLLLFLLRMSKFTFFPDSKIILEHIWYAYYIPMTAIPLFMFMAALRVEPVSFGKHAARAELILLLLEVLLAGLIMTNHLHSQLFHVTVFPDKEYTRGWLYFVVLFWMCGLGIGSLVLFVRKCTISAARELRVLPALCVLAGFGLLIWYLINGGAPKIFGYKLFHLQEAYCLPFITGFESVLLIGLVPANTGYGLFFAHSGVRAGISDREGNMLRVSDNWDDGKTDEDQCILKEEISGGHVSWVEDLGPIHRLNRELSELAEELEDENDLIRQENDLRAERVSYETRNRLYNRLYGAVRPQALRTDELLTVGEGEEEAFRRRLVRAGVLSAYIKRMGNLMLLTDGAERVSSGELGLALKESLEYVQLSGCACELRENGRCDLPADLLLLAYELFETALEDAWPRLHCCAVLLDCRERFVLQITLDAELNDLRPSWKAGELSALNAKLELDYEDDTGYVRLEAGI